MPSLVTLIGAVRLNPRITNKWLLLIWESHRTKRSPLKKTRRTAKMEFGSKWGTNCYQTSIQYVFVKCKCRNKNKMGLKTTPHKC